MSIDIEAVDVIRLIQQFLKENNLHRTLETMQEETAVSMNTVDNLQVFTQDILRGRWESVLQTIVPLNLPTRKLIDLYEQMALELIEMREIAAARNLIRQTEPMHELRTRHPGRYLHLEGLLSRTYFDPHDIYTEGLPRDKRRQKLAQDLSREVMVVPPSRLLTLIGQALKWQQHQGLLPPDGGFDLFRGVATTAQDEEDKFPREKHAESITFSPNGQYLVTGSEDGFIEVWNYLTGKLRTDLKYQAEDNCMSMKAGVLSLAFSTDGELLASGSREGQIKVWTIKNGQCVRRFPAAHAEGVTSLCFSRSGSQLLSTSFDQTVRLHGLKSGKILKEYRGHTSFVNSAMFTFDMTKVLSASSDGTVKVWDYKTCECLLTLSPQARHAPGVSVPMSVTTAALLQVQRVPRMADQVVVCPRLPAVHIMTVQGKVTKSFQLDKAGEVDFTGIAVSPRGDYIYAVGTDSQLYCFATETGELSQTVKLGDSPILGLVHHPTTNTLAAFNEAGHVSLWKATS